MRPSTLVLLALGTLASSIASAEPPTAKVEVVNLPETQNVSGAVEVTNLPEVQDVVGSVEVTNLPEVQDVFVVNEPTSVPNRTVVRDAGGTLVGVVADGQSNSGSSTQIIIDADGRDVAVSANAGGIFSNDSPPETFFEANDCSGEALYPVSYGGFNVWGSVSNSKLFYPDVVHVREAFPFYVLQSGWNEASCLARGGVFEPPDRCCSIRSHPSGPREYAPALESELPPFTLPLRMVKE